MVCGVAPQLYIRICLDYDYSQNPTVCFHLITLKSQFSGLRGILNKIFKARQLIRINQNHHLHLMPTVMPTVALLMLLMLLAVVAHTHLHSCCVWLSYNTCLCWVVTAWVYGFNSPVHVWPLTFIAWMSNARISDNQYMTSTGGLPDWSHKPP